VLGLTCRYLENTLLLRVKFAYGYMFGTRQTTLAAMWIRCICVLIANTQCRLRDYHL
jgi:hypothetical protein